MRTRLDKLIETLTVIGIALLVFLGALVIAYNKDKDKECHNQCHETSDRGFNCKKMCKVKGDCPHWED